MPPMTILFSDEGVIVATKLYDLAVKVGEYTDRSGQKKGRWQNVGAVMQGDDGNKFVMLARWFSPAGVPDLSGRGGESTLLSMFEPRDQAQQGGHKAAPAQSGALPAERSQLSAYDDDIPF